MNNFIYPFLLVLFMDEAKIKQDAKKLLDKFSEALKEVEKEESHASFVERSEFERQEKEKNLPYNVNSEFKDKILDNAPNKNKDFILTEKGSWK
jgi:hypothetical protein